MGRDSDLTHLVAGVSHGKLDLEIWVRLWDGVPMKLQSTQVWKSVSLQAGKGGSCPLPTASAGGQPLRDSPARQVGLPADTCLSSHIPQGRTGGQAAAASSLPQGARPGRDICLEGTFQEGRAEVALGHRPRRLPQG